MGKEIREITFKGQEHKARFLQAIHGIHKVYDGKLDPEYAAALYILTSSVSTWDKAESYVDRDGIDFEGMLLNVDWSGGYRPIITWAANLFNGTISCNPVELMSLDESNFNLAVNALFIRRNGSGHYVGISIQ